MIEKSLIAWSHLFEGAEKEDANTLKTGKAMIAIYNKIMDQNLIFSENSKENFTILKNEIEKSSKYKYIIQNIDEISNSEIIFGLKILFILSHNSPKKDEFIQKEQTLPASNKVFLRKINETELFPNENRSAQKPQTDDSNNGNQDKKALISKYKELEKVKKDYEASEQKLKDLQSGAKSHDVQHLKRAIKNTEDLIFQTESEIQKLESQIKSVSDKQEDVTNTIKQVKSELDALGNKNSEFQKQIEYTQKMQSLEDQFKQFRKYVLNKTQLEVSIKNKNDKLQNLIQQIQSTKDELTTSILISSKFDNLDESINIDGIETGSVSDLMDAITQLELEIADMKENTLSIDNQRELLERDNQILEKEIEELEEQRFELRDKKDKIKRAREELRNVQKSMTDNTEVIDNDIQQTISLINQRNLEIERLTALSTLISYRPEPKPMSHRFRENAYKF